jgi:hypothetical protein
MARWRLQEPHYLFASVYGEPNEWEYKETDRETGRERRKRFKVPFYAEKELIVCYEGSERGDDNGKLGPIIIDCTPTPAMEPLDDEAKTISAQHADSWKHPIDSLPGQGFNDALLTSLEKQLSAITARLPAPAVVSESGVTREEFETLQRQFAELLAKNAELEAKPGKRKVA